MVIEKIPYEAEGVRCFGHLEYDGNRKEKRPAVLIAHAWMGQDEFAKKQATELVKLGYAAFVADIYGDEKRVKTPEEAFALMAPLFFNRRLLRQRILAAFETARKLPQVDVSRIGAIGFCFGGLTVLELLRSGADVKGVVSFHGVLGNSINEKKAELAPNAEQIKGALLVLHGSQDPLGTWNDLHALEKEMSEARVDFEFDIYGNAAHSFTNPEVNDRKAGLYYEPKAATRSFKAMQRFFEEVLK